MKKLFLVLVPFIGLPVAGQAEDLYRIEVLVFVQPTPPESSAQPLEMPSSPSMTGVVDFRQYSCLPEKAEPGSPPRLRSPEDVDECLNGYLRLNELSENMLAERLRLENDEDYQVLHHAAWQQPVRFPDETYPVRLYNGQDLQTKSAADSFALDGTLKLSREQFLQIDVDVLVYSVADHATSERQNLRFRTNRKVRQGDFNYIDHPRIGILTQVTSVLKEDTP